MGLLPCGPFQFHGRLMGRPFTADQPVESVSPTFRTDSIAESLPEIRAQEILEMLFQPLAAAKLESGVTLEVHEMLLETVAATSITSRSRRRSTRARH